MEAFIELRAREYYNGGYISNDICIALSEISRVIRCVDDYGCTNVVMKDGKVYTLNENYSEVTGKIALASRLQAT